MKCICIYIYIYKANPAHRSRIVKHGQWAFHGSIGFTRETIQQHTTFTFDIRDGMSPSNRDYPLVTQRRPCK